MTDEGLLRASLFLGGFMLWAAAEALWPKRPRLHPRLRRWKTNLVIGALGVLALRLLGLLAAPLMAVQTALWATKAQIGLLPWLGLAPWAAVALSLLVLDAVIWAQHRAFHRWPLLWRLHRVHHSDRDLDVSSALRFHPLEILLSMLIKSAAVLVLGAPWQAVVIFEVLLNGMAMFNHANLRLPANADGVLRWLLVTPDLHRVHHSIHRDEQHSNFGFNLSLWDRLARTYRAEPRQGHAQMVLGLDSCQNDAPTQLGWSLRLPWMKGLAAVVAEPRQ